MHWLLSISVKLFLFTSVISVSAGTSLRRLGQEPPPYSIPPQPPQAPISAPSLAALMDCMRVWCNCQRGLALARPPAAPLLSTRRPRPSSPPRRRPFLIFCLQLPVTPIRHCPPSLARILSILLPHTSIRISLSPAHPHPPRSSWPLSAALPCGRPLSALAA